MSDHIPVEELADATEGLSAPGRAAVIEAHLAGCAECRALADALAEVTRVLADASAPAMPADVARRLDGAVAAEVEQRASAGTDGSTGPTTPALAPVVALRTGPRRTLGDFRADLPKRPFRRIVLPALVAAGAAAIVGFGGYLLSASAGLNEPPTTAVVVQPDRLASAARSLEQIRDPSPHRFSRAWQCAREVVADRITGLASVTYGGEPALLVYTEKDDITYVTVVTGCGQDAPKAGPTAPIGR